MKFKKLLCVILICTFLLSSFAVLASAKTTAVVNTSSDPLRMRSGKGTQYDIVTTIPKGATVTVLEDDGSGWCNVTYLSYTGYVSKDYLTSFSSDGSSDSSVYSNVLPEIYMTYINRLKAAHPNWSFVFYDTGLNWYDVIASESRPGINAISGNVISYRATSYNYNPSESDKYGTVSISSGNLNLRSAPDTSSSVVASLPNGTRVKLIGISGYWYKVSCDYGTGYVASNYISGVTGVINGSDGSLNLRSEATSSSTLIIAIPNGTVVDIVRKMSNTWFQINCTVNGTPYSGYVSSNYVTGVVSGGNAFKPIEGSSWYQAHGQVVQYYMDPRNFLTEDSVFQFEKLSYDSSIHNLAGVEAILRGSFMDGKTITATDGRTVTYAQAIMEAGAQSGASPYHIASRIIQEVGKTSPTAAATGAGLNGEFVGIYNFYNIRANTGIRDGLSWASGSGSYGRPWDTPYKSIINGASFIAERYIGVGQNTLYMQKFDIIPSGGLYNNQYMSNIQAPKSEASKIYNNYKNIGKLDNAFVFIIPVYRNMPLNVSALPAASDSPNLAADTAPVNPGELVPNPFEPLYKVSTVYGGDISGDGKLSLVDAKMMLEYAAKYINLTESQIYEGDINGDGSVSVVDAKLVLQALADESIYEPRA